MGAPGQAPQHGRRIDGIARLAEHLVVQDHFGIGPQDNGAGHGHDRQQPGTGLFPGHPAHVFVGRFAGLALFGNVQVEHAEIHAQAGQQLCPAGRFGCEIQHVGRIPCAC